MVLFGQTWLYSGKVVVFGKGDCIRAKVVVFGQKRLYSGKESCCIRARWLCLVKNCMYSE